MRIEKISWLNYRPFIDNGMSFDDEFTTIVIDWVAGVGKTSFLNSIYWCLYGEELFPNPRYIANGAAVKDALGRGKSSITVQVNLVFSLLSGERVSLTRTHDFIIKSTNQVEPIGLSSLEATSSREVASGFTPIGDAGAWVSRFFPRRLSPHFFIDGMNLGKFRKDFASKREAIASIAAMDALASQIKHLEVIQNELHTELEKGTRKKDDRKKTEREHLEDHQKRLASEIELTETQLKKFREEHGDPNILEKENKKVADALAEMRELVREKDTFTRLRQQSEEKVSEAIQEVPGVLLLPEVTALSESVESNPPGTFTSEQLVELLETGQCVCGASLANDQEAKLHLKRRLEELGSGHGLVGVSASVLREIMASSLQARGELTVLWNDFRKASEEEGKRKKILSDFRSQNENTLSSDLAKSNSDDVLKLIGSYKAHEDSLKSKQNEYDSGKERLRELNSAVKAASVESDDPQRPLVRQIEFVQHLLKNAERIHESGMEEIRAKVSEVFESLFREMTRDVEGAFEEVKLDQDLVTKVIDRDGQERQDGFSAGWELVAAFAFAYSLNSIAGFELPLIVDTPFGMLSKERKVLLTKTLVSKLEEPDFIGRQFIILATDSELDHGVRDQFAGPLTLWFRGQYDQNSQTTKFERTKK